MNTIKVFAYGSLLNQKSLAVTVPDVTNFLPARLYGFRRVFNTKASQRYDQKLSKPICVLNLVSSSLNDYVNGVVFNLDQRQQQALRLRENRYQEMPVKPVLYDTNQQLESAVVYIANHSFDYSYLMASSIQDQYLQICVDGCKDFGKKFLSEFRKTTDFWGISSHSKEVIWHNMKIE